MISALSTMNARERLTAALEGRAVDRLPFAPFLAYVWESFPQAVQERGQLAFHHAIGADPLWRGAPCPLRVSTPGVEVRTKNEGDRTDYECITPVGTLRSSFCKSTAAGTTVFPLEHPLKTEADYKTQLWIEEHTVIEYDPTAMRAHLEGDGREGLSLGMLSYRGKTAFQAMIEGYVGTQELTRHLFLDFPDTVLELHAAMQANNLKGARLVVENSEYAYFLTFEDSSTQNYSPEMYAQYIAPEIRAYCELAAAQGKGYVQHACGHVRHLIPQMVECGVRSIESLSPVPTGNVELSEARRLAGPDVCIIGGIEPLHFLNTPEAEFPAYVRQVIEDARGGRFILANSDSCPPGVSVEKFRIAAKLAREAALD